MFRSIRNWFRALIGAPDCSHGWSEAQPVDCCSQVIRPEGAKEFLCPFRAVESSEILFHGLRETLHPWLHSVTPIGAIKPETIPHQHV